MNGTKVKVLTLSANVRLSGTIPASFVGLLSFSMNALLMNLVSMSGTIPSETPAQRRTQPAHNVGSNTRFTTLAMSRGYFTGPLDNLHTFHGLRTLVLSGNRFS